MDDKKQQAREFVQTIIDRVGERPRKAAYGAYVVAPQRGFADEQKDEAIVLLLRSHPITQVKWVLVTLVLLIIPIFFFVFDLINVIPARFVFMARMIVYLIALGYAFENFLRWYYSVLIITNERITDIDFYGVLSRNVAYAPLNKIEQPSLQADGFLRTYYHFGDVNIATAATEVEVEIKDVPNPDMVLRVIAELSEELEKRRERGE